MILTYKIKHGRDFGQELSKAHRIAKIALSTRTRSSADVKHIGLKSMIANQILRKYSKDKKAKRINKVVLAIPNQGIKIDKENRRIHVPCLKLDLEYQFRNDFEKVNQIEIDKEYVFVSVSISEPKQQEPDTYIGVDLNTTGHCAVAGNPDTGKVEKLGKSAYHIHNKYKNLRRNYQKNGKYKMVKRSKGRETRLIRDLNHKISRKIVETAKETNSGIKMEDLKGIRNAKSSRRFRYSLNSWSFYQLREMIEYKAKLLGISVVYIDPAYTSQICSRCGLIGNRNGKDFRCPHCGHVDNADVNASFNIAKRQPGVYRSDAVRDVLEGSTDTPKEATARTMPTLEPHGL